MGGMKRDKLCCFNHAHKAFALTPMIKAQLVLDYQLQVSQHDEVLLALEVARKEHTDHLQLEFYTVLLSA